MDLVSRFGWMAPNMKVNGSMVERMVVGEFCKPMAVFMLVPGPMIRSMVLVAFTQSMAL